MNDLPNNPTETNVVSTDTDGQLFAAFHSGPCHVDDLLAMSLLLTAYPELTIIRTRDERRLKNLKDGPHFVVDVGREYDPARHLFDHHQDKSLHASYILVAEHLFGTDWAEQAADIFPWWTAMDIADRRGIKKALSMTSPTAIATAPVGTILRNRVANRQMISAGDALHGELLRLGRALLSRHTDVRSTLNLIFQTGQMHTMAVVENYEGPIVDYIHEDVYDKAKKHMQPPFITRVFESPVPGDSAIYRLVRERLREEEREADVVITRTESNSWSIHRSRALEGTLNLSVCEDMTGCSFAHNQGFIAVFEQRSRAFHGLQQAIGRCCGASPPEYEGERYGEPAFVA